MDGSREDASVPHGRSPAEVTLFLVGKVGSGKSATANSILGRDAFVSEQSFTETCQMTRRTFCDGTSDARTVNVIDTPGKLRTITLIFFLFREPVA